MGNPNRYTIDSITESSQRRIADPSVGPAERRRGKSKDDGTRGMET